MGSSHPVELVQIEEIRPHDNADRLELAIIKGWQTVVRKGEHSSGEIVVYIPIDSVLDTKLEAFLFPPDSKVRLNNSRVRSIKLRGALSQGMVVPLDDELLKLYPELAKKKLGDDVADVLGISKYEPPQRSVPSNMQAKPTRKKHRLFREYTDIENFKHHPNLFVGGEQVVITCKLHGSNFRAGWLPTEVNSLWKKVLKFFGRLPRYEYVYGSRRVQLQNQPNTTTWYQKHNKVKTNIYQTISEQYQLKQKIPAGHVVYGEIIGHGIQKNYEYGHGPNEWSLYVFDVVGPDGKYLDHYALESFCNRVGLSMVPILYVGPYSKEILDGYAVGPSVLAPEAQPIREGCVIRPITEQLCYMGRKLLKRINDEYLLKGETSEFH